MTRARFILLVFAVAYLLASLSILGLAVFSPPGQSKFRCMCAIWSLGAMIASLIMYIAARHGTNK